VSAFKELQARGLFYCDISDKNLFLNPSTGDVLICDNDNVGSAERRPNIMLGTPRYMAPEIVRGEAEPSSLTDLFSMAVLLFLLLFNDHPLQGAAEAKIRCFDAAAMQQLYGTSPVFLFDPVDDSNRPVPGVQVNAPIYWALYPAPVKEIFTQAFTVGLNDPGSRPTFTDWHRALGALQDAIVYCSHCGKQNFYDAEKPSLACWKCSSAVPLPMRLTIQGRRTVMLNSDTKLYRHHLKSRGGDPGDRGESIGDMVRHPTERAWGLRNLGESPWFTKLPDGSAQSIDSGRAVLVQPGTEISFGEVTGVIEA
jgi:DNA-binding helix-hairpin-helix protein with protein kinase domain